MMMSTLYTCPVGRHLGGVPCTPALLADIGEVIIVLLPGWQTQVMSSLYSDLTYYTGDELIVL